MFVKAACVYREAAGLNNEILHTHFSLNHAATTHHGEIKTPTWSTTVIYEGNLSDAIAFSSFGPENERGQDGFIFWTPQVFGWFASQT